MCQYLLLEDYESSRAPRLGDVGIIVHLYGDPQNPKAYAVEGFENGNEIWIADFVPEELEEI